MNLDKHGLKISGEDIRRFSKKSAQGVHDVVKNYKKVPPILGFIALLLTSFEKKKILGVYTPVPCVHLWKWTARNLKFPSLSILQLKFEFKISFIFSFLSKLIRG